MSKNYTAIHYIQHELKNYDPGFVNCVVRCFNIIEQNKEPDGCLSNSAILYICAKKYGYNPTICYGLCNIDGRDFYHVWLELNNIIIDLSIYGNVNYSPYLMLGYKIETPFIGKYDDAKMMYGRFKFDQDWDSSLIGGIQGKTLIQYMDGLPQFKMWKLVCKCMDKTFTKDLLQQLRKYAENVQF